MAPRRKIERCSCDEALHLRKALRKILEQQGPGRDAAAELIQVYNLAYQGLRLRPLVGEPNP